MKKKRILLYGLVMVCLAGAGICGYQLYQEMMPRITAELGYKGVREMAFPQVPQAENAGVAESGSVRQPPDFDALIAWNPDVRAWIWSPETDIDYPVVQGPDNDYYLNRTAYRNVSIVGSIFMESANDGEFKDDLTVLYGHHIRGGRMFSSLSGYKTQAYYETHPELYLYTPEQDYLVELFAGGILDGDTGRFPLNFTDEELREEWLAKIFSSSTFQSGRQPDPQDRLVALCTCTYEYQNARYVVYGILKELEES